MSRVAPDQDPFKAIADANRRRMLDHMRTSERTVGELADLLGITQPSVSQHMTVLRLAHLVDERHEGRRTLYSIRGRNLQAVAEWLEQYEAFWTDKLDALEAHLARQKQ